MRFSSYPDEFGCPARCKQVIYDMSCREFSNGHEFADIYGSKGEGDVGSSGSDVWLYYLRQKSLAK